MSNTHITVLQSGIWTCGDSEHPVGDQTAAEQSTGVSAIGKQPRRLVPQGASWVVHNSREKRWGGIKAFTDMSDRQENCGDQENSMASERHGAACTSVPELADSRAASLRLRLCTTVAVWLGVERLVRSDVADDARALVGEARKGERLAHLEDLFTVLFVA